MSMASIGGISSGGMALAGTTDGAQVTATTGLALSAATQEAQAMGYDVRNSWKSGSTAVTLGDDGSVTTETSDTLYSSDVQQIRQAFNTSMGAYWMVETDSTEQTSTSTNDATVNADGSTAASTGQSSNTTVSHTLSYVNPYGRAMTASQFNAAIKQYGTQPSGRGGANGHGEAVSVQSSSSAVLSQSADVMDLLGSVPRATAGSATVPGLPGVSQGMASAGDEMTSELLTLITGVTPQDAATGNAVTV